MNLILLAEAVGGFNISSFVEGVAANCIVAVLFLFCGYFLVPLFLRSLDLHIKQIVSSYEDSLEKFETTSKDVLADSKEERKMYREELNLQRQHSQTVIDSMHRYLKVSSENVERLDTRIEQLISALLNDRK